MLISCDDDDVSQMRYRLLCRTEKFFRYAYNLDEVKMLEYHNKTLELEAYDMDHLQDCSTDIVFKEGCDSHMSTYNFRKDIIANVKAIIQNAR
jgi:hypothetical protein